MPAKDTGKTCKRSTSDPIHVTSMIEKGKCIAENKKNILARKKICHKRLNTNKALIKENDEFFSEKLFKKLLNFESFFIVINFLISCFNNSCGPEKRK